MRAKAFLGRRRLSSPAKFSLHVRQAIDDWAELKIKTALGMEFRQTSRVVLVRPRWMPRWAYRRLLRSIVLETKDLRAR